MNIRPLHSSAPHRTIPAASHLLLLAALAVVPASRCGAQPALPDTVSRSSVLSVTSRPAGALVVLDGEHTVRGRTPFSVSRGLSGRYRVTAHAPGYEGWKSTLYLDPGVSQTLTIEMSRKERWKAGARSLLFPGWGQAYTGQKTKALLFAGLEAGTIVWSVLEHRQYQDRVDELEDAEEAYDAATTESELRRLFALVEERRRKADDEFDERSIALYTAGAVWGINVLDAVFFFPSASEGFYSQLGSGGELTAGFRLEF